MVPSEWIWMTVLSGDDAEDALVVGDAADWASSEDCWRRSGSTAFWRFRFLFGMVPVAPEVDGVSRGGITRLGGAEGSRGRLLREAQRLYSVLQGPFILRLCILRSCMHLAAMVPASFFQWSVPMVMSRGQVTAYAWLAQSLTASA